MTKDSVSNTEKTSKRGGRRENAGRKAELQDSVTMTLRLERSTRDKLQEVAALKGITASELARQILEENTQKS